MSGIAGGRWAIVLTDDDDEETEVVLFEYADTPTIAARLPRELQAAQTLHELEADAGEVALGHVKLVDRGVAPQPET